MIRQKQKLPTTDIFIAQDGTQMVLSPASGRYLLSDDGGGMPPIEYVTERGPFQHGESVKDSFLRPRTLQLHISQSFCRYEDYLSGKESLLDILRPNRGISAVLRRQYWDGRKRDLTVTIEQGPGFQARKPNEWDEWRIDEVLRLIAYNPVYFDPTVKTAQWLNSGCGQFPYTFPILLACGLTFPITFPIVFSSFGGDVPLVLNYAGTWEEYPSFIVVGPLQTLIIRNLTTNEKLQLNYILTGQDVVTIDLTYGAKRIYSNNFAQSNLIPYLSSDSDLATFHLQPGVNNIQVTGFGGSSGTQVNMSYHERYIGIS